MSQSPNDANENIKGIDFKKLTKSLLLLFVGQGIVMGYGYY